MPIYIEVRPGTWHSRPSPYDQVNIWSLKILVKSKSGAHLLFLSTSGQQSPQVVNRTFGILVISSTLSSLRATIMEKVPAHGVNETWINF